jgi:hypothetical protein
MTASFHRHSDILPPYFLTNEIENATLNNNNDHIINGYKVCRTKDSSLCLVDERAEALRAGVKSPRNT